MIWVLNWAAVGEKLQSPYILFLSTFFYTPQTRKASSELAVPPSCWLHLYIKKELEIFISLQHI